MKRGVVAVVACSMSLSVAARAPIDPAAVLAQPSSANDVAPRSVIGVSSDSTGAYNNRIHTQPTAPTVQIIEPTGKDEEKYFTLDCGTPQYHLTHGRERMREPAPLDVENQRSMLGESLFSRSYGSKFSSDNLTRYLVTFKIQEGVDGKLDPNLPPEVSELKIAGTTGDNGIEVNLGSNSEWNKNIIKISAPKAYTSNRSCSVVVQNPARTYHYGAHMYTGMKVPSGYGSSSPSPYWSFLTGWIIVKPGFPSDDNRDVVDANFWNNAMAKTPRNIAPYSEFIVETFSGGYTTHTQTWSHSSRPAQVHGTLGVSGTKSGFKSYLALGNESNCAHWTSSNCHQNDPWGKEPVGFTGWIGSYNKDLGYGGVISVSVNDAPTIQSGAKYSAL